MSGNLADTNIDRLAKVVHLYQQGATKEQIEVLTIDETPIHEHTPLQKVESLRREMELPENKNQLDAVKKVFEETFGVDTQSRTVKQWKNLVTKYGIQKVMKLEKMTKRQVKDKMKQ